MTITYPTTTPYQACLHARGYSRKGSGAWIRMTDALRYLECGQRKLEQDERGAALEQVRLARGAVGDAERATGSPITKSAFVEAFEAVLEYENRLQASIVSSV